MPSVLRSLILLLLLPPLLSIRYDSLPTTYSPSGTLLQQSYILPSQIPKFTYLQTSKYSVLSYETGLELSDFKEIQLSTKSKQIQGLNIISTGHTPDGIEILEKVLSDFNLGSDILNLSLSIRDELLSRSYGTRGRISGSSLILLTTHESSYMITTSGQIREIQSIPGSGDLREGEKASSSLSLLAVSP